MKKLFKDMLLTIFLIIAMIKIGNTQEFDDGGVMTKDGCYTLLIVTDTDEGKSLIIVKDCRGGRAI
jgi:hypothetical protein